MPRKRKPGRPRKSNTSGTTRRRSKTEDRINGVRDAYNAGRDFADFLFSLGLF